MDFSKLKFRIDLIPQEELIFTRYPEIADILVEYLEKLEETPIGADKAARYIIYTYSKTSPLVDKMLEEVNHRKLKAFQLAGVVLNEDEVVDQFVQDVLKNENKTVNYAIIQYLKFTEGRRHFAMVQQIEAYYNFHLDLNTADKGTDKKSTIAAINDLEASISKLSEAHFSMDEELSNFVASFNITENRRITPEDEVNYQKSKQT